MNDLILKILKEFKHYWYIFLLIAIGIVLMSGFFRQEDASASADIPDYRDAGYILEVEERVEIMLKSVAGAGDCKVSVSLQSGSRKTYVRENNEVLVIKDKSGNENAVVLSESVPEIAGITVASKGAGSVSVREEIIKAVSTLLGIGTNKICVVMLEG